MKKIEYVPQFQNPKDFDDYVNKALNEREDCQVHFIDYKKAYLIYKEVSDVTGKTTRSNVSTKVNNGTKKLRKPRKA